jgi:type IV pilus assembly protein PilY1
MKFPGTSLLALAALSFATAGAEAAAPTSAPQVLLAITNSESMDGTTAGAIMVGSGSLASTNSTLNSSSSPVNYTIPSGFTPPLNAGSNGSAPYTVSCGSYWCDNGPSRMNMTKTAIKQVLTSYGSSLNFGLYTYSTGSASLYQTWVYHMSPTGSGFTFTNTQSSTTVANPCYNYTAVSTSSSVKTNCTSLAAQYTANVVANNAYMTIGATSDNPLINDVLYAPSSYPSVFLTYGTVSPANPYSSYSLATYNSNSYLESYSNTAPNIGGWGTTPTNAGYVPFSPQVFYAARGFGYGASQSATTGSAKVAMSTDPSVSTDFTTALAPETNNPSSAEIKAVAGQSAIYGLLTGAKSYLNTVPKATCQSQYVVLLTDGLPTLDKSGKAWPPLGTTTGNAYSLTATFNTDGSFASSNSQAATDALAAVTALASAGIKVYVIGLGAGVDPSVNPMAAKLLQAMAIAGGTSVYYPATDSTTLNTAFLTIIDLIYTESAVSAPVAPISVANGSSYEYQLTTIPTPASGHVKAYPVSSAGVASGTESWDAATLMTTANRTNALMAAKSDNSIVKLASVETAAFGLTATTCVPNVSTLLAFTITPSYTYSGCSYLNGRDSSSLLGTFSTQNTGTYVGPPGSALLVQKYSTYASYASGAASRTPMLMFTNDDGFLYALNASSGALLWGWTSRNLLPYLQNYTTFAAAGYTDGNFTVVDAMNGSNVWGSYVVGSLQSGAQHFSLKLDSSGTPASVVYDTVISGGSSAGDKAGTTGATPLRQPPVIAYIGNSAYHVYVVTVGTTSTLYETNVATGATTSAAFGFQASSTLTLNPTTNRLYLGSSAGTVWMLSLSGTAATDVSTVLKIGTTVNPATAAALANVLYVGYAEVAGVPYVYALNPSQLTVFGITSAGWTPLWSTSNSAGYKYSGSAWTASASIATLTASSVVSDLPLVIGSSLLVPVYTAGSGCSAGSGYYNYFSLTAGGFPANLTLTQSGSQIKANTRIGSGPAFTPSLTTISGGGVAGNSGSGGTTSPGTPMYTGVPSRGISWQQR